MPVIARDSLRVRSVPVGSGFASIRFSRAVMRRVPAFGSWPRSLK